MRLTRALYNAGTSIPCSPHIPQRLTSKSSTQLYWNGYLRFVESYPSPSNPEFQKLYESLYLDKEEYIRRLDAIDEFRLVAKRPNPAPSIAGSFRTKTCLRNGDVDMMVMSEPGELEALGFIGKTTVGAQIFLLKGMKQKLATSKIAQPDTLTIIPGTQPVLKYRSIIYGVQIDVTANNPKIIETTSWVQKELQNWPPLRPVLHVLKTWLNHRSYNIPYSGGLGSYALALTLIGFIKYTGVKLKGLNYNGLSYVVGRKRDPRFIRLIPEESKRITDLAEGTRSTLIAGPETGETMSEAVQARKKGTHPAEISQTEVTRGDSASPVSDVAQSTKENDAPKPIKIKKLEPLFEDINPRMFDPYTILLDYIKFWTNEWDYVKNSLNVANGLIIDKKPSKYLYRQDLLSVIDPLMQSNEVAKHAVGIHQIMQGLKKFGEDLEAGVDPRLTLLPPVDQIEPLDCRDSLKSRYGNEPQKPRQAENNSHNTNVHNLAPKVQVRLLQDAMIRTIPLRGKQQRQADNAARMESKFVELERSLPRASGSRFASQKLPFAERSQIADFGTNQQKQQARAQKNDQTHASPFQPKPFVYEEPESAILQPTMTSKLLQLARERRERRSVA